MASSRSEPAAAHPEALAGRPLPPPEAPRPTSGGEGRGELLIALIVAAIVTGIFIWWPWKQAAYFGTVFLPGAIVLYALLILLLIAAPLNFRLRGPLRVALIAVIALTAWTLLSFAWTDWHDAAVQYAQHDALYATLFVLGIWTCSLAAARPAVLLAPVAIAGAVIGLVTTITLATGTDVASYVHSDATMRFPIGYRNAEAAFMMICLWPTVMLAAEGELPWQLRALLTGVATMLLDIAVLAESRGSLPAAALALGVLILLAPRRLRAAGYLALAALPVLPALPTLLDVFQHGHAGAGLIPLLHAAGRAIALSAAGSVVLAAICIHGLELRLDLGPRTVTRISRVTAVIAAAVVIVGGAVFVERRGGPLHFIDQRVTEFKQEGDPNLQTQGTRFGVNVGSNRRDFWRVALDQGGEHPLLGGGAGSFTSAYLRQRDSSESPHDPHSVELLMLSEIGIPGLLLLATFLTAAAVCAVRSRRAGDGPAVLVCGALAAGAYWLAHSSYDWFWNYPGLTAPVFFLLGAAAAPAFIGRGAGRLGAGRWIAAAATSLALLAALPLFLSQRYANRAYDEYPADTASALSDLDRAADLDPFDADPLLAKGVIELRLGRDATAATAFRDAIDRQPDGYAGHYFLARTLADSDPAAARSQAQEALRLNPLDLQTRRLERRLRRSQRS